MRQGAIQIDKKDNKKNKKRNKKTRKNTKITATCDKTKTTKKRIQTK